MIVLLLLGVFGGLAHAAEIGLSIQPDNPIANQSFRLTFSVDEPIDAEPDFTELEAVVDILRRNRQTSIQWINGKNSQTTIWTLEVMAKVPGAISIPAVAFGSDRSRAVVIKVRHGAGAAAGTALLLEIEVDEPTPYVQQQVILTARLLQRLDLHEAKLTDPSTDADTIIKHLGKDVTYQTTRDGKRYDVFERRYSLFPQTSGKVTIKPLLLTAQIVQASRSLLDPFRQSIKIRRIESNAIVLEVKPIPPSYTGDTWLPARRLQLRDDWDPDETTVKLGEPLTRTVFLWADGLNAGQLPEVPIGLPEGVKSYPDQAQTSERETAIGFNASRQQKYAIIPNVATELVFPALSITWWNTATDQMEVARLKEHRIIVQRPPSAPAPAAGGGVSDPSAGLSSTAPDTPLGELIGAAPAPIAAPRDRSLIAAVVFLLGWIATAGAWWLRSRRAAQAAASAIVEAPPPALPRTRRDVLGACKAHDPPGTKRALIVWGRVAFEDPRIATLGELIKLVGAPLDQEIRHLDKTLYGDHADPWRPSALREAFENSGHGSATASASRKRDNPLPELYRLSGQ